MSDLPKHRIEYHSTGMDADDLIAHFKVRRNGKVFYIKVLPDNFVNSPEMTKKYLIYLEVLWSGEEVIDDVYDTDVYEWLMTPFKSFLLELAPPPPGDPKDIVLSLQQHLFAEIFTFELDIIDEQRCPRQILGKKVPIYPSNCYFEDDFLDGLEKWTKFKDPAKIILSFESPEDALYNSPRKVLIENGQIGCFYKPCHSRLEAMKELTTYKKILEANLYNDTDDKVNICKLHGVVIDESDFILGILLSYIDCPGSAALSWRVIPEDTEDPPLALRKKWVKQLETSLAKMHKAGIVWGDVKAENVLLDKQDNAWITDFGGGYTHGWVDKELAGRVEGDLMAMRRIRALLFPNDN